MTATAHTLNGPARIPDPTQSAIIMLHGYGSNGHDLFSLSEILGPLFPTTAFYAPHAPEPFEQFPTMGHQWYSLLACGTNDERHNPDNLVETRKKMLPGINKAAPVLNTYIDEIKKKHDLEDGNIALLGFSQGTMMALHTGLKRPLAGIVGFSGLLVEEPEETENPPPVLLIHGQNDTVVDPSALSMAKEALTAKNIQTDSLLLPGLEHGIDDRGLTVAVEFLRKVLA